MPKHTILVAEDDLELLKIEEAFLISAGYSVLRAQDAYRAVHLTVSEAPSLLLLDVNMPAGNGLSVHQRIRNAPAVKDTPVIYLTGEKSPEIVKSSREMGAFSILYKPLDFDVLLTTVKAAISEAEKRKLAASSSAQFAANLAWEVHADSV
jgi:DNA-binding response OmpR family regulator